MSQRRAKRGGEYGVNGEWYDGGKWIANTEAPKRAGSVKATGRQEIAPWVWEVPPEGKRSLYAAYSGSWEKNGVGGFRCRNLPVDYWGPAYLAESAAMAERWNAGERWIDA